MRVFFPQREKTEAWSRPEVSLNSLWRSKGAEDQHQLGTWRTGPPSISPNFFHLDARCGEFFSSSSQELSADLIQIYNIDGTCVLVEFEAVIWRCFYKCFSVTFFPFWCLKFLETLALLTKLYSHNHSINTTIILFCFYCLVNCVVLYLIIFVSSKLLPFDGNSLEKRHEVVQTFGDPSGWDASLQVFLLPDTLFWWIQLGFISVADGLSENSTEEMSSSSPCGSTGVLILLPVSMMSDCWTVILLNNAEPTSNSPHRAFASLFQRHYFPSRQKHVSYDRNGWDCGVIDPGRPIKHLHSAKTHPCANVFLELTSSESSFSFYTDDRLLCFYQWEFMTVTLQRSSHTVENVKTVSIL